MAVVSQSGHVLHHIVKDISRHSPAPGHYVQSSSEIWNAVCYTVRQVIKESNVIKESVAGIGFDATCSLVLVGKNNHVIQVGDQEDQDIVMWMDHRAEKEAELINSTKHPVLDYVGGQVSLEMQLPKLLWLKKHRSDLWASTNKYFDLPDWLVYKATGYDDRSLCSLVCKWNYWVDKSGNVKGWDADFFKDIGLYDLSHDDWEAVGRSVVEPGKAVGKGLTTRAAEEMGLNPGTPVAASLIDAHAGSLGMLAGENEFTGKLGLVSGTSTCHMLLSENPVLVPGVWGPFWSAVLPGLWLMEGGQSATGGLIDHILASHPAFAEMKLDASRQGKTVYKALEDMLEILASGKSLSNVAFLTKDLHIWPDFHGNRSPLADPNLTGSIVGLTLDNGRENLALQYLATIQAISYGTKHIIESIQGYGHAVESIKICGGLSQSSLFLSTQADALGMKVVVPGESQSVLLGSAILGMAASEVMGDLKEVVSQTDGGGRTIQPSGETEQYHIAKYMVFKEMVADQKKYKNLMSEV